MTKKAIIRNSLLLLIGGLMMVSFFAVNPNPPCAMVFTSEDSLDLAAHEVVADTAKSDTKRFRRNILALTDSLSKQVDSLRSDAFCMLKMEAESLLGRSGCTLPYVTALQIHYGLTAAPAKIQLYYQPVILCRTSYDSATKRACYTVHREANLIFKYEVASHSFQASTGHTADIQRYKQNIRITHFPGDTDRDFRPPASANDTLADASSLFIPFREIRDVIRDNENCAYVKFWNSFISLTYRGGQSVRKHSLLLGPSGLSAKKKQIKKPKFYGFNAKFADRSLLCPPDCDAVCYALVQ